MRAVVWFLLALAVVWGVETTAHAKPIRLWHAYRGAEEQALEEILGEFDGGEVVTLSLGFDQLGSKLAAAIPLGEGPDLFIDSHERLGDYLRRGLVAPIDPAIGDPDAYVSSALDAVRLGEHHYGVPIARKALALYVNGDLVERDPATVAEIRALAASLPTGTFPLAYEAENAYAHAVVLAAFDGRLLTEDGRLGMQGDAAEASLRWVKALLDDGIVPREADGGLVTNLFRSGRAATAISGPWLAADLGDAVAYRVVRLPTVDETGNPMRSLLTVEAVMISPDGAQRAPALALAAHLASAEAAQIRQRVAQGVTARRDVQLPGGDSIVDVFAAEADAAIAMPSTAAMRLMWEPTNRAVKKVLRGLESPDRALAEAARRFEDVRRPPPPKRSPAGALGVLGVLALLGAIMIFRRSRDPELRARLRRSVTAYRYTTHAVIAVGLLVIAPLAVGALAALFAGPPGDQQYVGLGNFVEILSARGGPLLQTGSFYVVLLVTLLWTVLNVAFHVGIGLSLGLLLSRPMMRLRGAYRVLLILPWAVPSYVTALAWKGMFHRQFGAVNALIDTISGWFGFATEPISWFSRFSTAFTANLATNVWLGFPFMMVVTIGALTAVPRDVLEAAEVDGATRWQRLWHVTLPIIRGTLMPAVVLGAIWTFNMFNVVFLVSGGEPDGTTDILVSEAYRWAFTREARYGYAAAYAVLIFLLLLGTTRLIGRKRGGSR